MKPPTCRCTGTGKAAFTGSITNALSTLTPWWPSQASRPVSAGVALKDCPERFTSWVPANTTTVPPRIRNWSMVKTSSSSSALGPTTSSTPASAAMASSAASVTLSTLKSAPKDWRSSPN